MTESLAPASPRQPQQPLQAGDLAPDFTLRDQNGADVTLSSFRGQKNVVIVFYPFAFSGICTGELCEIRDNLGQFVSDEVQVLAISPDAMFSQRAFADREGYFFPLLSDFWPHGAVARQYGIFDERGGVPLRGTFLVDTEGVIRWTVVNGPVEPRDFAHYYEAVAALV